MLGLVVRNLEAADLQAISSRQEIKPKIIWENFNLLTTCNQVNKINRIIIIKKFLLSKFNFQLGPNDGIGMTNRRDMINEKY